MRREVVKKTSFDKIASETTVGIYHSDFIKKVEQSKKQVEDKSVWENLNEDQI